VGPIPRGLQLHHRCQSKSCVNPDHLEVVSPRDHTNLHQGKLTLGQVREIKERLGHGEAQAALAREFDVSKALVCLINGDRRWA
jgi:hypothetical protein